MQNKKITKALTIGLCAVVLAPSLVSAKEFKDVTKNGPYQWAYSYIDELSDKGIINGYPGGDFKPDNSVTLEETVELIKGLLNPTSSQISAARNKYNSAIDEAKVPEWAKDAFAIAMENNVFSEATLKEAASKGFIGESSSKLVPDRNTIAVYFARALSLSSTGDEAYLRHEDKASIPASTRGYLANLVKEGIFSSTGSDGKFEGTRSIRRSEMAKITKLSYDYLSNAKNKAVETTTVSGKIVVAANIGGVDTVIIEQSNKNTLQLKVNSSTKITSDNKTIRYSDLKPEQEVKITYQKSTDESKNNIITTMEVTNSAKTLIGYITNTASDGFTAKYRTDDGKIDTSGTSQISTTDTKTFTLENNTRVYMLGREVRTSDLSNDDLIEFKTNSAGKVTEAVVYPRSGNMNGEVTQITNASRNSKETIKVKLQDNKTYTFYGNEENRTSLFRDIRVGDKLDFSTNYKTISRVNDRNSNEITGTVTYFREVNNGKIDIDVKTNSETLQLYADRDTRFRIDGVNTSQISERDLMDRSVRVYKDGSRITELEVLRNGSNFTIEARVTDVRNDNTFNQLRTTYSMEVDYVRSGDLRRGDRFEIEQQGNYSDKFSRDDIVEITGYMRNDRDFNITDIRLVNGRNNGRYDANDFYGRN